MSISYDEAHIYFTHLGIAGYLSHLFVPLFGQNDISLRLPMILLHLWSSFLLYRLSFYYLKFERNRLILLMVYMIIPGVISASLLINDTGFVIFALMVFGYLYKKYGEHISVYGYLAVLVFAAQPFFYFYVGLFFYALANKKYILALFSFLFLIINFILFGSDVGGYPTGHFLDALAVYSAIFSPVVFIYLVYALYRSALTKKTDVLWYLATTALVFSLLLSLRQRVHLEIYAPYLLLGLLHAARIFESSYRVRLPRFRKHYKVLFNLALAFLALNFVAVISNKALYIFLNKPKKHFAYKNHIAKELAQRLKKLGIKCIDVDYKLQLRLEFYGIRKCNRYTLVPYKTQNGKNVTISYFSKPVFQAYVTKVNNK